MITKTKAMCLSLVLLSFAASYGMSREEKNNKIRFSKTILRMKKNPNTAERLFDEFINQRDSDLEKREEIEEMTGVPYEGNLEKEEIINYLQERAGTPENVVRCLEDWKEKDDTIKQNKYNQLSYWERIQKWWANEPASKYNSEKWWTDEQYEQGYPNIFSTGFRLLATCREQGYGDRCNKLIKPFLEFYAPDQSKKAMETLASGIFRNTENIEVGSKWWTVNPAKKVEV